MKKILFVCHGNICRSPMAEYVMKDLVKKAGLESQFQIVSAATSWEEIGNPVYPPARRKLAEHGISCGGHAARQLRSSDYKEYDLLIGMDKANLRNMYRICGGDFNDKMHLLLEYADRWKGPPREPSEAGRVGRGEARECSEFSPQAETEKRWPIRGTPATSTPPGGMCWRGAKGCFKSWLSKSGIHDSLLGQLY